MKLLKEREHYVLDNLRLVNDVIKKYFKVISPESYNDYYQEGCLALVKAAILFDETNHNVKFTTYAYKCIYCALTTYMVEKDLHAGIKYPSITRNTIYCKYLELRHDNKSIEDICNILHMSRANIIMFETIGNVIYLDADDDNSNTLLEHLSDPNSNVETRIEDDEKQSILDIIYEIIQKYPKLQQNIYMEFIQNHIGTRQRVSRSDIAEKYNITENQIRYIIGKINKDVQTKLIKNGYFKG